MPNWCYTTYKCVGDLKEIKSLHKILKQIDRRKRLLLRMTSANDGWVIGLPNLVATGINIDVVVKFWNPEFYDWEKSISIILKFLQPKPAREWVGSLVTKIESTPKNQPVVFEYRKKSFGVMYSEKIRFLGYLLNK